MVSLQNIWTVTLVIIPHIHAWHLLFHLMPLIDIQLALLSLPLGSSHLLMVLPYRKRSQTLYSMAMVPGPAWDDQDPDDCQLQA